MHPGELGAAGGVELGERGAANEPASEGDIADPMKWPMKINVDGKQYPDYAECVAISTAGAQREMVVPALLAIVVPVARKGKFLPEGPVWDFPPRKQWDEDWSGVIELKEK